MERQKLVQQLGGLYSTAEIQTRVHNRQLLTLDDPVIETLTSEIGLTDFYPLDSLIKTAISMWIPWIFFLLKREFPFQDSVQFINVML